VILELPPLSERREDISLLASDFARQRKQTLTAQQLKALEMREYAGNVRELQNVVTRLLAHESIDAPTVIRKPFLEARELLIQNFEAKYLKDLLSESQGNVSSAAKVAGLSRSQFYRILKGHPSLMKVVRSE
jgi:DNA-binding NtrC family response regulator